MTENEILYVCLEHVGPKWTEHIGYPASSSCHQTMGDNYCGGEGSVD